ncbi:MAG: VWA domain-containing protein [Thermoanaerobaculia bacterium]
MRSGRWFLGVIALLAAAGAGADNAALSPSPVPALPTPPPLVAVNPPAPAPQAARGPEALRLFGRLDDDRSIVYIASGAPDARVTVRCGDSLRTLEIWTYLEHPTLGKNARILFYPESPTGSYRYWTVLEGEAVLLAPSAKGSLAALEGDPGACADALLVVSAVKDISRRQGDNNGGLAERGALAVPHILPPAGAKPEAPAAQLVSNKPLTGKERKKLTHDLPEKYRQFLDDVEPIITEVERDTLLKLGEDYQREHFIEDFWRRRSQAPDGIRIPFRDIYELRLQQAKELYRNINTDMGRIYVVNGPPDGVRKIDCQDVYWPLQIWYYERLESLGLSKVVLLFYQSFGAGDYKMWTPFDGAQAIVAGGLPGAGAARRVDFNGCFESRDVQAALSSVSATFGQVGAMKLTDDIKQGPKPDVEGADHILQMTTDLQAGAATLPVQRVFRFPEAIGSRIRMELAVLLERDSLTKKQIGEETFFDLDVVGEVVRDGRLIDNFRYRFDFPASTINGPFVPLTVERDLYPGEYRLKVKVADANRNSAALISEKVKVPDLPDATISPEEKAAREAAKKAVTELVENSGPKGSLSLLPIARELATGLIRFETRTSSNDISFAEFYLNNTRVVTKRKPPFSADLDLGELPRKHIVKVIGYAKDGKPIAQDEIVLNEGREAFRLRITHPAKGAKLEGPTRVVADVAVPETKRLTQVEFYVNDRRAAVLYQEPFQQLVDVPKSQELGFLRVVATLDDGSSTEDVRYYNAPKYLSEENVRAVELYTSVFSKGRPVTGLKLQNFAVFEDTVPQTVDGFEVVTNLPLSLGIGVDTSGSMEESIVEAQKAAVEFLKDVMTPRDRSFLVTFDNEPQLVSRFTTDRDRLGQALAGLRAQGSTALWDALVYGLYQYQGTRGRKAYVILTDGEDRCSHFTFEAALDYAKKTGVAVYFIGLKIGATQLEVRHKLNRVSKETGGAVYYVDSARNLAKIYAEINEELRSQYLLSYQPQNKSVSSQWRKIEVKMTPSNLTARTISGYYP